MILECIVENGRDARKAEELGFHRLELVSAMKEGGLTPSFGTVKTVMESVKIPVQVMIRPHGYHFEYGEEDWRAMREDIQSFMDLGVKGIVFGCLKDGQIDQNLLEKVIREFPKLDITFHRAFDHTRNQGDALEILCQYASHVKRILTSGGKTNAMEGMEKLQQMITLSNVWSGPTILVGGGLKAEQMKEMHSFLQADEYHFGSGVRKAGSFANGFDIEKVQALLEFMADPQSKVTGNF
ncbi:MAG: copper homeostasis protein CutC [Bacillus sp. (in: firmicutes)]